jgi:hypothetical protein
VKKDVWILQFIMPTRKIFHDQAEAVDFAATIIRQPSFLVRRRNGTALGGRFRQAAGAASEPEPA